MDLLHFLSSNNLPLLSQSSYGTKKKLNQGIECHSDHNRVQSAGNPGLERCTNPHMEEAEIFPCFTRKWGYIFVKNLTLLRASLFAFDFHTSWRLWFL